MQIIQAQHLLEKTRRSSPKRLFGIDNQNWDSAEKALARFPNVIEMTSADLDWATDLGDVEVNQPQGVVEVIQDLRAKAEAPRTEDKMKAISHFLRITVLGGILFLTPIVVLVFILDKSFDLARRALKPVTAIIPDRLVSGAPTEAILAIVLIALLCFLAGLFARTRPAQRIVAELEVFRALEGSCL